MNIESELIKSALQNIPGADKFSWCVGDKRARIYFDDGTRKDFTLQELINAISRYELNNERTRHRLDLNRRFK